MMALPENEIVWNGVEQHIFICQISFIPLSSSYSQIKVMS